MASTSTAESGSKELKTNPRGIPHAPFVSDIEHHIGGPEAECESALRQFQEAVSKYRYMELNLNQRKSGLEEKIPDIKKSLSVVEHLISQANVMLAYKLPEAQELLTSKLSSAQQNISNVIEDLEFLREQITIMEVNTARVYNWDVRRRRLRREAEAAGKVAPDPE
ncbi:unnamed protein product [Rhizoctonia solani]|uniref:Prefoldin subunit 3 n=1 Tax=Rhizoctonia solani TaxID=456999 RepID=A0A8H3C9K3_9AGAM|nr:unnamed protein product [Rhizoctonia solani]